MKSTKLIVVVLPQDLTEHYHVHLASYLFKHNLLAVMILSAYCIAQISVNPALTNANLRVKFYQLCHFATQSP